MDFTHLHVHSDISPDGLGTVNNLVKSAKEKGFKSMAITDHGSLGNHVSFWSACQDYDIKPIFGLEAYLQWNGNRHHITLNSRTKKGFETLIDLSNEAHKNYTSGFPLMTADMMQQYNEDIYLFTGCPVSPIHAGSLADGANFVGTMCDIFQNRVYVEMMFVLNEDLTSRPLAIAKQFNLPIVVTNDVHFTDQRLSSVHTVLTDCRKGYSYNSEELYMKTANEMLKNGSRFFDEKEVIKWMATAYDFSQSVEAWSMVNKPRLPKAQKAVRTLHKTLETALQNDLDKYTIPIQKQRYERFNYELKTLEDLGFVDYFAILLDIVNYAKSEGVLIGPGRGSAAGSYILYLLGITSVDPIEHGLYFERFLNPARKEYPDVDLDIESDERQKVLEYANNRWGAIPISTYSRYSHKSLVNDLGNYFKIDKQLTKEAGESDESKAFLRMCEKSILMRPSYDAMIGQIRHAGKHAGGAIITDQKIPIEKRGDYLVAAWTEGLESKDLSKIGVVKYDILGVSALSQIKAMRKQTGKIAPKPKDYWDNVFVEVFQKGDTAGVFQWGSDGIRKLTMDIVPKNITDLTIINSLYRPGALDAGTAMKYPEYILNPRLIEPRIDEVLKETKGVLVFQEQVMSIFALITGGSLVDADLSRRIIFKPKIGDPKWEKQVKELHDMFMEKGLLNGFEIKILELVWSEIYTHSRYSFNRAHSAAYAHIAYEMAWFKLNYPLTFYSVMLQYDIDMQQLYLFELVSKGFKLSVPHINKSIQEYTFDGNTIFLPLNIVKFLSEDKASTIVKEREENGVFKSFEDFRKRISKRDCNARVCKLLYKLGAFDGITGDPKVLFVDDGVEQTLEELQIEILGFVLPTKTVADYIKKHENEDNIVVGFIHDFKDKKNAKGKGYRVYYCLPNGMFWSNDPDTIAKIKKGDFLKVYKNNWGKEVKKQRVKITG